MARSPRTLPSRVVFRGLFRDLTARQAAAVEIRKLKLALEQSPATVVVTGTDGTIEYVNAAFQALTGYSPQEAVGANSRILKSDRHDEGFYQELWQTIQGGRVWRGKFHNRRKNGELFWEQATIAPVFDETGRITCFIAVKEDVTERMRTEQALEAARSAADAASQAKSAFLANMSHELRTPLNAVLGFIHLLQDTGLTTRQREYLDKAGLSAEHLRAVIGDILDFSRIEAGHLELEAVPFALGETLDRVAASLSRRASDKGLKLSVELDAALPRVLGDPQRLGQMLSNLGENAVKFTETGAVTLAGQLLERTRGRVRLRLEVRDSGIGMTAAVVARLFQPFNQADDSSTRRFGGTGLGLAIAQRLARLMGGEIAVSSRVGQGSSFTLDLALREADPEPEAAHRQGPEAPIEACVTPMEPRIQGVDIAGTLARLEIDSGTYLDLLRRFGAMQGAELAAIRDALARGDRGTAQRHAHSLKGTALNLGAEAVSEAARAVEACLGGPEALWPGPVARLGERLGELVEGLALLPAEASGPVPAGAPDWPAVQETLETLRRALGEDDASAGGDLARLAALLQGHPLREALEPLKARIENYDYSRALELLPAFMARVSARPNPPR
jgi:PAS domain S-box-containing protein